MDEQKLLCAWTLLENCTPLRDDCGALCGAACCTPDEDGQGGMFLFPGEERLIGSAQWAQIRPANQLGGCLLLTCGGRCEREKRPLSCRIFPLTPTLRKSGEFGVRIDRRAKPVCPLTRSGLRGLSAEFVEKAKKAIVLIAEDPEGAAFLRAWSALESLYAQDLAALRAWL